MLGLPKGFRRYGICCIDSISLFAKALSYQIAPAPSLTRTSTWHKPCASESFKDDVSHKESAQALRHKDYLHKKSAQALRHTEYGTTNRHNEYGTRNWHKDYLHKDYGTRNRHKESAQVLHKEYLKPCGARSTYTGDTCTNFAQGMPEPSDAESLTRILVQATLRVSANS